MRDTIERINVAVHDGIRLARDRGRDTWRDLSVGMKMANREGIEIPRARDGRLEGDCDDMTFTALSLAITAEASGYGANVPRDRLYCFIGMHEGEGHMVAAYEEAGVYWIFADTLWPVVEPWNEGDFPLRLWWHLKDPITVWRRPI
ncbi:MAG: hypothetical protein AAF674_19710 [Pseudomonadota bacterium]